MYIKNTHFNLDFIPGKNKSKDHFKYLPNNSIYLHELLVGYNSLYIDF